MIVGVPFSLVGIGSMMSMGVMPGMSGMMGSYQWMMSSSMVMMSWFFVLILISGATVLLGAIMLYARPEQRRSWGILVIVFSAIGTLGMSVFSLGAILGIVGGILAVS